MRRVAAALVCSAGVVACGGATTGTATPAVQSVAPSASATPQLAGSQRTVLSPLGLNIHSDPATTATVVATAAQGIALTVLDYRADNGGWFKVMGQSTTGWIVADPTLTAAGTFTSYSSDARMFNVLIPDTWTFIEETSDVVFRPQQGQQTIVARTGGDLGAFGPQAPVGYVSTFSQPEVVCGYTGELVEYVRSGGGAAQPASPSASATSTPLADYAVIRLVQDPTHAIQLAFNYASKSQLEVFQDFYNSITFPFPQCEAPLPSSSPAAPPT